MRKLGNALLYLFGAICLIVSVARILYHQRPAWFWQLLALSGVV